MSELQKEEMTYPLDNPPGEEWVLLRSGGVPAEIHKGSIPPRQWLAEEETGYIFVRNKETDQWLNYDRKGKNFITPPEQWQKFAANEWKKAADSSLEEIRKTTRKHLARTDVFDSENHVNWNKLFELLNKYSEKRADIFPNGTENMSEADIINYIRQNYSFLLAGGVNPLEFPELIDEELRPLCDTINQTTWGRSYDGCAGHPDDSSKERINPYLRVLLDLDNPSANKFINETRKLAKKYEQKYKDLEIHLHREKVISSKRKPRIIYCTITLGIDPKKTSKEYSEISTSFFNELNERTSALS